MQKDMARQLRDFQAGNGTMPLDWLTYHHILPYAQYAGKVGPAGGYADVLQQMPSAYGDKSLPKSQLGIDWWYWVIIGGAIYFYLR